MPDRRWSELTQDTPQDTDEVALRRANDNFKWTFQGLRTWLGGFFEALGAVSTHNADANAHVGTFEPSGSVSAHNADVGAHTGTFESAGAVAAHDTDSAAHGGVETAFAAHDGSRTGHPLADATGAGLAPQANGDPNTWLDGTYNFSVPPTTGEANTQTNQGGGAAIGLAKSGVDLPLRTLVSGDNSVLFTQGGTTLDLRATLPAGSGTLRTVRRNSGSDISDGRPRINFIEGANVTLDIADDVGGNEVTVQISTSSAGEANTSSNSGGGVQLALTKVGFDLPFRTLSGDSMIAIAQGANTADFSLNDGSITAAKLADSYEAAGSVATHDASAAAHGGVENAFAAHQGVGGTEHPAATGATAGFLSAADKTKLDGIDAGAQANAVDSVFGRTGAVTASSGDYTAAQVTGALGTGVSSTMSSSNGHAATTRTVASGGTFTPNPLEGQFVSLSGVAATTIGPMSQTGFMVIEVPEAVSITLDASWNNETSPKVGRASILQLARVGATRTAEYS